MYILIYQTLSLLNNLVVKKLAFIKKIGPITAIKMFRRGSGKMRVG